MPSVTNGHISAVKTALTGTPILQSDVAITHGNSGGPAFNSAGQVIGIATWGEEVQGFNFLVPINTAMEFVRQAGAAPASGEFDQHWFRALDLFDAGKCNESKVEFGNALEMMPGLPDATQYRQASVQCWDSKNFFERFMITSGWVVYVAIGLVILAGAILALRRRPAPGHGTGTCRRRSGCSNSLHGSTSTFSRAWFWEHPSHGRAAFRKNL